MNLLNKEEEEFLEFLINNKELGTYNSNCTNYNRFPESISKNMNATLEKLKSYNYLSHYLTWGGSYSATLTPMGLTYFKDKRLLQDKGNSINIGLICGGNIVFDDIMDSHKAIEASVKQIEQEIEAKGGDDKEELKEILYDVKVLISKLEYSRQIPKNSQMFKRIGYYSEKHQWFYPDIIGLLGQAVLLFIGKV